MLYSDITFYARNAESSAPNSYKKNKGHKNLTWYSTICLYPREQKKIIVLLTIRVQSLSKENFTSQNSNTPSTLIHT